MDVMKINLWLTILKKCGHSSFTIVEELRKKGASLLRDEIIKKCDSHLEFK